MVYQRVVDLVRSCYEHRVRESYHKKYEGIYRDPRYFITGEEIGRRREELERRRAKVAKFRLAAPSRTLVQRVLRHFR